MPDRKFIRGFLATTILLISFALVATVLMRQFKAAPPENIPKPTSPEIDMTLTSLNFSEMRGNDKLWDLAARRADYDKDAAVVKLVEPKTDIYYGKAGGMTISSRNGSYQEQKHLVTMREKVHAVTRKGMKFDTEYLEYNSASGEVTTALPVRLVDGRLSLTARGMLLSLNDETVRFKSQVNAVIEGYNAKR